MSIKNYLTFCLFGLMVLPFLAVADAGTVFEMLNKESVKRQKVNSALPALAANELNSGGSAAYVQTGTDKKTAYFRFGDVFEGTGTRKWEVSFEVPYDENADPAILGDFNGLADTANISFSLSNIKILDRPVPDSFLKLKGLLCEKYLDNKDYIGELCVDGDFTNDYVLNEDDSGPCKGIYDKDKCTNLGSERMKEFDNAYDELVLWLPDSDLPEPIRAVFYSVEVKFGPEQYSFRDPMTLAKESSNETPWSLSASYNFLKGFTSYGVGIEVQESFTQNSETQLCEPFESFGDVLSCSKARIGAPRKQKRQLLSFKMSHRSNRHNFAIQPKISYDFEEGEVGIDLPIYLLRNKDKLFTGGINIGWQSEDNNIVAGIFIGKAFELFSN